MARTWYVLHVKPRAEKKVDDFLAALRVFHQLRQVEHALRLPADLRAVEHFTEGEYVKVVSGPLRGLEGQVRRVGNSASIVLSVDILGRAIEAFVDPGSSSAYLTGVNKKVKITSVMGFLSDQLGIVAYSAAYATGRERI